MATPATAHNRQLWIGADHAGFELKERLKIYGMHRGIHWIDLGPNSTLSVDYPSFAHSVVEQILRHRKGEELLAPCGVLVCGSGVGMSIAANRHRDIRAVLAWNTEVAALSRLHNASNVLCLGARLIDAENAEAILDTWLATPFEGGRHQKRVDLIETTPQQED